MSLHLDLGFICTLIQYPKLSTAKKDSVCSSGQVSGSHSSIAPPCSSTSYVYPVSSSVHGNTV